jgi:hypothetical protein
MEGSSIFILWFLIAILFAMDASLNAVKGEGPNRGGGGVQLCIFRRSFFEEIMCNILTAKSIK